MADQKSVSFDAIMRDVAAKKFATVYFLSGEEPYYTDRLEAAITANALSDAERDFNQTIVYAADTDATKIANAARRFPMMAERQLIVVREAQGLQDTEPLEDYLAKPQPQTVLVLSCKGKTDKRKRLRTLAAKAGVAFESAKLRDNDLPGFISRYMKDKGAAIDEKSVQLIADSIGSDLSRIAGELDKLLIAVGKGERITPDIVAKQIGISKDFNAFELKNAIIARDVFKANQIVRYFAANPKAGSAYTIAPLLYSYFQGLAIALNSPNHGSPDAIAEALGLKTPWAAKDYMAGIRNYDWRKVWHILYKLREIDAKSKGLDNPNTPSEELLKELIHFILH